MGWIEVPAGELEVGDEFYTRDGAIKCMKVDARDGLKQKFVWSVILENSGSYYDCQRPGEHYSFDPTNLVKVNRKECVAVVGFSRHDVDSFCVAVDEEDDVRRFYLTGIMPSYVVKPDRVIFTEKAQHAVDIIDTLRKRVNNETSDH